MRRVSTCAVASLSIATLLSGVAVGQTGQPVERSAVGPRERMLTHVTAQVFERTEKLLEPTETFRLVLVAKQVSMAQNCEGFEVDPERHRTVMGDILGRLQALTAEGMNNLPFDIAVGAYSMALGGEMAVAAYDMDAYCAEAAEMRQQFAEGAGTEILVWKDAP